MRTRSWWMSARTGGELLWMRATICGITASHVSMDTCPKPSMSAASTSGAAPWLNHRVSRRRISCCGVHPCVSGARTAERDTPEETRDGGRHVSRRRRGRNLRVVLHRRGVEERPVVPSLRPLATRVRRGTKRAENVRESRVVHIVRESPTPLAELEKRARHEFRRRRGPCPRAPRRTSPCERENIRSRGQSGEKDETSVGGGVK